MEYIQKCTFCHKVVIHAINEVIHKELPCWVNGIVKPSKTWCKNCYNKQHNEGLIKGAL